jgi:hypothetical protein
MKRHGRKIGAWRLKLVIREYSRGVASGFNSSTTDDVDKRISTAKRSGGTPIARINELVQRIARINELVQRIVVRISTANYAD